MIEITHSEERGEATAFIFSWSPDDESTLNGTLISESAGVMLAFGPTVAVARWPAWLRAVTHFSEEGGEARIWLDPHQQAGRHSASLWALDMRGTQARKAFAEFLHDLGDAVSASGEGLPDRHRQAIQACRGMALALVCDEQGMQPVPANWPELFWPAPLPLLFDDFNADPVRQHVRLTYRLPRVAGWLESGCSLRLFRDETSFGMEFRALDGDHLPSAILPACVTDGLGPLLRFTIARDGQGTFLDGQATEERALRIVQAVAHQVARDLAGDPAARARIGFAGEVWRHWLAAMPDLLASCSLVPFDMTNDY